MKKVLVGILVGLGLVIGSGFVSEVSACDDVNCDFAEEVIEEHIHEDLCTETHYLCGNEECGGFYCVNLPCWCGDCNGEASDYIYEQDADREHQQCALCGGLYGVEECDITCECGIEVFELEVPYIAEHKIEDSCEDKHILCENCGAFFCLTEDCYCGEYVVNEHYVYEDIYMNDVNEENVVMTYEELSIFEEMIWDIYVEEYCVNECYECDSYYYKECMCNSCEDGNECYECLHADYEIFIADYYDMIIDLAEDMLVDIQETIEEMNQASVMYYEF